MRFIEEIDTFPRAETGTGPFCYTDDTRRASSLISNNSFPNKDLQGSPAAAVQLVSYHTGETFCPAWNLHPAVGLNQQVQAVHHVFDGSLAKLQTVYILSLSFYVVFPHLRSIGSFLNQRTRRILPSASSRQVMPRLPTTVPELKRQGTGMSSWA